MQGRPEDIATAQAALDSANAKLSLLLKGATDDIRQAAQSAVDADTAECHRRAGGPGQLQRLERV